MIEKDIISSINHHFSFLEKNGYDHSTEYYKNNSNPNIKYDYAIIYSNSKKPLKLSIIYYDYNPNLIEKTNEFALQVILFKNNEHIDFSRLLSKDLDFAKDCAYQYFIFSYNNDKKIILENFLLKISESINRKYCDLINGETWIDIKYDLRDDY
jgi:hypothetical protein